ncbi:MAG: 4Fe-4S dicluster domain-containing protein [Planctomycetota bacterium]
MNTRSRRIATSARMCRFLLFDFKRGNVTYDPTRGEPRRGTEGADAAGDCIDCYLCVAVCPTGIDIRNGTQLECVGCSNCIDACDAVMHKVGKPDGLVRFDSQNGIETGKHKFWRPRLALYSILLVLGLSVFMAALDWRENFEAQILRSEGRNYVLDETTGAVRNIFFVRIANKSSEEQTFSFEITLEDGNADYQFPAPEATLRAYQERRIPLVITQDRAEWDGPFRAQVIVRRGETQREVEAQVLGPSTR